MLVEANRAKGDASLCLRDTLVRHFQHDWHRVSELCFESLQNPCGTLGLMPAGSWR